MSGTQLAQNGATQQRTRGRPAARMAGSKRKRRTKAQLAAAAQPAAATEALPAKGLTNVRAAKGDGTLAMIQAIDTILDKATDAQVAVIDAYMRAKRPLAA